MAYISIFNITILRSIPKFDDGFEEVMNMWQVYCEKKNEKEKEPTRPE